MPSVSLLEISQVYLAYKDKIYAAYIDKNNTITLPQLSHYPPYFQILDQSKKPLFGTIYIAKQALFTKPKLYESRAETYIVMESD